MVSNQGGLPHFLLREIDILKKCSGHPNIIRLLDVHKPSAAASSKGLMLVFEFAKGGDLCGYLEQKKYRRKGLPMDQVIDFTEQILQGINHIHSKGYLHRDLKPANILVGEESSRTRIGQGNRQIKLADFGLARAMNWPLKALTKEI